MNNQAQFTSCRVYKTCSTAGLFFRSLLSNGMNKAVQHFLYETCFAKWTMRCSIICKFSEFYYNFITTELGKLKIFEQFCPPKELFFSSKLDAFLFESESVFSEKWFIFTSNCNNTQGNHQHKKVHALPNHIKGQKFLRLNNFLFYCYTLYMPSSQNLYKCLIGSLPVALHNVTHGCLQTRPCLHCFHILKPEI